MLHLVSIATENIFVKLPIIAVRIMNFLKYFYFCFFAIEIGITNAQFTNNILRKKVPENCNSKQYFQFAVLQCYECPESTKQGPDGMSCMCEDGYKTIEDFGGFAVKCEKCQEGHVTTPDRLDCLPCVDLDKATGLCAKCEPAKILHYRDVFGVLEDQQQCSECRMNTEPSRLSNYCEPCNPSISGVNCACTGEGHEISGGVCFVPSTENNKFNLPDISSFKIGSQTESAYAKEHLRAAVPLCWRGNQTACQLLANLCVLDHYLQTGPSCTQYLNFFASQTNEPTWLPDIMALGFGADTLLRSTDLPTSFTFDQTLPNSKLALVAAVYGLNGSFKGLQKVTGGMFQLCKAPQQVLDAAYKFGQKYRQKCEIPVRNFWNLKNRTEDLLFYDLYLQYEDETPGNYKLYPIYVLNLNIEQNADVDAQSTDVEGRGDWVMTRRFFVIDNVAGRGTLNKSAIVVRYPDLMQLNIELRPTKNGRIFPPFLTIKYAEVQHEKYEENPSVPVEFAVEYSMNTYRHEKDLEITMGVLCSFGALWSMLRAWSWSRRAGKAVIDFPTVLKCLLYLAGTISDIFFVVMLGTSLWLTFAYKAQLTVVYMLPTSAQETSFVIYISLAAALKAVEMLHLLLEQVSSETVFIDWERPRGHVIPKTVEAEQTSGEREGAEPRRRYSQSASDDRPQSPITIWRTYLVANEWNELQSYRKTSYIFQLFLMILFLKVVNFEGLAIVEPGASLGKIPEGFQGSRMSRFAVAASLYLLIGFLQWFINVFIIERCFVDHFRSFMDLCSISNISVLCLSRPQFGYYIHGRSVHGHADTNMREMNEMLQRERDNLCSQRGLEPNTDDQCFVVCMPNDFREEFEKILTPLRNPNAALNRMTGVDAVTARIENIIQVYNSMNQFLTSFIDKQLPLFASYSIQDRTFFESLLDIEFQDTSQNGIFYRFRSTMEQVRGFDRQFSGGLADRVSGPRRSEVER